MANDKHEVDQHWAHDTQHHHTDVNIGEEAEVQTPSPWGRWLLILLVRIAVGRCFKQQANNKLTFPRAIAVAF